MIKFFENIPEVIAVMSLREDGSMKLFPGTDVNGSNRTRFFEKNGIDKNEVISAEIAHGTKVEIVDSSSPRMIDGADGLITKETSVFLSITMADCIPLYVYESQMKIIAIAHCGWRGIVDGIVENLIKKILALGGQAENLKIAFGPGINKCHFEIQEDVSDRFSDYMDFVSRRESKIFVDLKGIMRKQLASFQIEPKNIEDNDACTMEDERYFSFRRDKPEAVEAMVAIIGLKIQKRKI